MVGRLTASSVMLSGPTERMARSCFGASSSRNTQMPLMANAPSVPTLTEEQMENNAVIQTQIAVRQKEGFEAGVRKSNEVKIAAREAETYLEPKIVYGGSSQSEATKKRRNLVKLAELPQRKAKVMDSVCDLFDRTW